MAIRRGNLIKASDVVDRLQLMVNELSAGLSKAPFNIIFASETSAALFNRSGLSSYSDDVKLHFLQSVNDCKEQFKGIADSLNVKQGELIKYKGFGDFSLSCAALASNMRVAKYLYFASEDPKLVGTVENTSFLQDNVITREKPEGGAYTTADFEYNHTSNTTSYADYRKFFNAFKDYKESDFKSISELYDGTGKPLYRGQPVSADIANAFINTNYGIDTHICKDLSCEYAVSPDLTTVYTVTYDFTNGYYLSGNAISGSTITDYVNSYTKYNFRSFTNCKLHLIQQDENDTLGTLFSGIVGWTRTKYDKINANTPIDYKAGDTIIANENITVYPVYHFTQIIPFTFTWRNMDIYGTEPLGTCISALPKATAGTDVTVGHITVWHNERNHSHEAEISLIDNNTTDKKPIRLLHYSRDTNKCYQRWQDGTRWGRVVASDFYSTKNPKITLHVNKDKKINFTIKFTGSVPSGGASESTGTFTNLYIQY